MGLVQYIYAGPAHFGLVIRFIEIFSHACCNFLFRPQSFPLDSDLTSLVQCHLRALCIQAAYAQAFQARQRFKDTIDEMGNRVDFMS